MENLYKTLAEGGGYNLPFLLRIFDGKHDDILVINDNSDLEHNGETYRQSNFKYVPNYDGDTTLSIELARTDGIIDILEDNYSFSVEAVGILFDGEVTEISQFRHKYGEGSWTGKSLELKLKKDDRLDMTFPALIFNSYNNRGNN